MKDNKNVGIQIASNTMDVYVDILSTLKDDFSSYHWDVLYIDGISIDENVSIIALEEDIRSTEFGKRFLYSELIDFGHKFYFYDILLLGNQDAKKRIPVKEDIELIYKSSDITIELFDSSYWRFFSNNRVINKLIENIGNKYKTKNI
jgi:hypothetical protein